ALVWGTGRAVYFAQQQRSLIETSLRRTNEALVRSNAELRRFAHVAAHDLQTPLRAIGSFAELLNLHYADRLDEKGREWLERIRNAVLHMQTLVRDLLTYSRIETQESPTREVRMEEVLDRVLSLLESEIRDTGALITRTKLPVVVGDATQLVQLLLNLLQNAIKYRSTEAPRIQVAAERRGDRWVFSVADNGIGIEPRHAERIFEVFERLHTAQEYQGTGIGLAICRRVVQRHGGEIWVESEPGRGSTFFFTLPAVEEEA
ncbi:MAG: GHKL domain-containing protein, partial [Xanthomonadaceae bacterium]|nr:GHKL domain-containing protein [Xanthomonadaceae bacterium]